MKGIDLQRPDAYPGCRKTGKACVLSNHEWLAWCAEKAKERCPMYEMDFFDQCEFLTEDAR